MLIFAKHNYKKGISEIKQNNFSIWLKLDKSYFKSKKNLFLCFVYTKPYTSKDLSESTFAQLERDISLYSPQGDTMIGGDFNVRTGVLDDFIQNDHMNDNFEDCPLPIDYIPDIPLKRDQIDVKFNLHGTLLTSICISCLLRIVNGRFL